MPRIFEKQHYKNNQIFDTDDLFMSHNSANDFSATLAQIQCMPVASCQTGADVVEKRATLVTDSFGLFTVKDKADETKKLIGRIVSVNFTNKNTAASMTLNIESTGAFPVTSHGIAVKAGAIGAGNYTFRLMPYGESFSWDVLDNGGLIEVKADKNVYWDNHEEYTAAQVNSALVDFIKRYTWTSGTTHETVASAILSKIERSWGDGKAYGVYFCHGAYNSVEINRIEFNGQGYLSLKKIDGTTTVLSISNSSLSTTLSSALYLLV